jgi:hypothetical protein
MSILGPRLVSVCSARASWLHCFRLYGISDALEPLRINSLRLILHIPPRARNHPSEIIHPPICSPLFPVSVVEHFANLALDVIKAEAGICLFSLWVYRWRSPHRAADAEEIIQSTSASFPSEARTGATGEARAGASSH